MAWTVVCPNSTCLRKLSLPDAPGDTTRCPYCNQVFMVRRAAVPSFQEPSVPLFNQESLVGTGAGLNDRRKRATWPAWLIGLLIIETLVSAFCGILVAVKMLGAPQRQSNPEGDLLLKASGPSNFFFKPHSAEFMDDGTKPNESWTKVYALKDRSRGTAISFKIFEEDVPEPDVLERIGRAKLSKLFPEARFQIQAGAIRVEASFAGEPAISIPIDITPIGVAEGEGNNPKLLSGELRICVRRGIAYWFATWGPEGTRGEQEAWDKGIVFGNARADWVPKSAPVVFLTHDSVKIALAKSVWKVDSEENVKVLVESRPGSMAHAEGTIVNERKSKSELTLVALEGKKAEERARGLFAEWQKKLSGSDEEAGQTKVEPFGEEGIFFKLIINQKVETLLFLHAAGESSSHLVMGECRFDEIGTWKSEFMKIAKVLKGK